MNISDFLSYVKTRQALNTPDIFKFMNEMSDEARRITFQLNTAYHTPEEVRRLLSELFGYTVPASLRVFPPFYTDFGKNITVVHQRLLPLSGPWRSNFGRRMPDRSQRRICHAEPRPVARRKTHHLSGSHRARKECLGRFQRHYPPRSDHRRKCRCSCRRCSDARRTGQYHRRWRAGQIHPENIIHLTDTFAFTHRKFKTCVKKAIYFLKSCYKSTK